TVKAIWLLASIYNIRGEWSKVTEVRELLPTLRFQVDFSAVEDFNSSFQRESELRPIQKLVLDRRYADAIEGYKQYLAKYPRSTLKNDILFRIAVLYRQSRDFDHSQTYIDQLKNTKLGLEAMYLEAMNLKSIGQFEASARLFESFVSRARNHSWREEAL